MLADLRESGCLTASTRILRADTGAEVAFGELMRSGERPMVWSLDERLRMVARPMINVFPSGRKEVFRLRLASGREVEATGSHPFMKFEGWTPLAQLKVGDRIAAPRRVPEPIDTQRMPESELISLARMIGDGSCLKNQPIRYEPVDEANLAAVTVSAAHSDGAAIRDDYLAARVPSLRPARQRLPRGRCTPIAAWLAGLGLFTKRSHENAYRRLYFAPPMTRWRCFCGICGALVALFGGIPRMVKAGSTTAQPVGVSSTMWLNCCFGLGFFLDHTRPKVGRPRFVAAAHSWREGSGQVPSSRRRSRRRSGGGPRDAASAQRTGSQPEPGQRAEKVWAQVRNRLSAKQMMDIQLHEPTMWKHSPSRSRPHRAEARIEDRAIHELARGDAYWDTVVEITSIGDQHVFDGTVSGTHNFVANGISLHNSLEQDADVVILLHRPDAFDRDDPRGEKRISFSPNTATVRRRRSP